MDPTVGILLIIVGLILIALEMVHPGAFLLVPGTIVLAAGIIFLVAPDDLTMSPIGPLIIAVVAILAGLITIPWYQRMGRIHRPMSTTPDSLTGEQGTVIAPVVPNQLSGKVRVRSEIWSARSDRPIPAGTQVRVQGGEGVAVWVLPLDAEPAATAK